jgi:hypothetical protein
MDSHWRWIGAAVVAGTVFGYASRQRQRGLGLLVPPWVIAAAQAPPRQDDKDDADDGRARLAAAHRAQQRARAESPRPDVVVAPAWTDALARAVGA